MPHGRVRVAPAAGAAVANFFHGHRPYVGHVLQAREELPGGGVGVELRGDVRTLSENKNTTDLLGNPSSTMYRGRHCSIAVSVCHAPKPSRA